MPEHLRKHILTEPTVARVFSFAPILLLTPASCHTKHLCRFPTLSLAAFLAIVICLPVVATGQESEPDPSDFTAAALTVDRFREAVFGRDSLVVAELLLDDVRILGSGRAKEKNKYLDLEFDTQEDFFASMTSGSETREVSGEGDVAWVTTTSQLQGTYQDKEVNLKSTETMILRRTDAGWRIAVIHSSSCSE